MSTNELQDILAPLERQLRRSIVEHRRRGKRRLTVLVTSGALVLGVTGAGAVAGLEVPSVERLLGRESADSGPAGQATLTSGDWVAAGYRPGDGTLCATAGRAGQSVSQPEGGAGCANAIVLADNFSRTGVRAQIGPVSEESDQYPVFGLVTAEAASVRLTESGESTTAALSEPFATASVPPGAERDVIGRRRSQLPPRVRVRLFLALIDRSVAAPTLTIETQLKNGHTLGGHP